MVSGQVDETPEVSGQVNKTPEVSGQVDETPEVSGQVGETPELSGQVDDTPEVSGQVDDTPEVSGQVDDTPEVSGQVKTLVVFRLASPTLKRCQAWSTRHQRCLAESRLWWCSDSSMVRPVPHSSGVRQVETRVVSGRLRFLWCPAIRRLYKCPAILGYVASCSAKGAHPPQMKDHLNH